VLALTQCITDAPVARNDRDDLPRSHGKVYTISQQTGMGGLIQQVKSLLFDKIIVRVCLLLRDRQIIEQPGATTGNRVVEQARDHLINQCQQHRQRVKRTAANLFAEISTSLHHLGDHCPR
jgi:hypothetical protein